MRKILLLAIGALLVSTSAIAGTRLLMQAEMTLVADTPLSVVVTCKAYNHLALHIVNNDNGVTATVTPLPISGDSTTLGVASTPLTVAAGTAAGSGLYQFIGAEQVKITLTGTGSDVVQYAVYGID